MAMITATAPLLPHRRVKEHMGDCIQNYKDKTVLVTGGAG